MIILKQNQLKFTFRILFLGLAIFNGITCDWSGEPGPAPTSEELCQAHIGKNVKKRLQCYDKSQVKNY